MILENHIAVAADPDAVFALLGDVERVAGCLPGATLDGQDGDTYRGRVKFKVGPVSAAYAGTVRFTEVAAAERRIRLVARGTDTHAGGDAEAAVTLVVSEADGGAALNLHTDLSIRGKIAQFGKSAISAVSNRLLDQFATNLAAQLTQPTVASAASAAPAAAADGLDGADGADNAVDGLAMLLPPGVRRYAPVAVAVLVGLVQGWLLGRIRTQDKLIKELRRARE